MPRFSSGVFYLSFAGLWLLLAIVLFPIVWLITLPFRILGIAVHGVFALLAAILFLPVRILRGPRAI